MKDSARCGASLLRAGSRFLRLRLCFLRGGGLLLGLCLGHQVYEALYIGLVDQCIVALHIQDEREGEIHLHQRLRRRRATFVKHGVWVGAGLQKRFEDGDGTRTGGVTGAIGEARQHQRRNIDGCLFVEGDLNGGVLVGPCVEKRLDACPPILGADLAQRGGDADGMERGNVGGAFGVAGRIEVVANLFQDTDGFGPAGGDAEAGQRDAPDGLVGGTAGAEALTEGGLVLLIEEGLDLLFALAGEDGVECPLDGLGLGGGLAGGLGILAATGGKGEERGQGKRGAEGLKDVHWVLLLWLADKWGGALNPGPDYGAGPGPLFGLARRPFGST